MSTIPTKQQATLLLEKFGKFAVQEYDVPKPGPGELLVEIHSTSLNPVDWMIQTKGVFVQEYPAVLGHDGAGIVKGAGEGITEFAVGDKVLFLGHFISRNATFQQYSIASAYATAKIPANLTFDEAATIPLVLNTAAFGLYSKNLTRGLGLVAPWEEGGVGKYADQAIVIVAGASSVGQHVIQLAKLSGFSPIIATASSHNENFLKSLGATHVIDRNLPLVDAVRQVTSKPIAVAFDAVADVATQIAAYGTVAPGGAFASVRPVQVPEDKLHPSKKAVHVYGTAHDPTQKEDGVALWRNVTALLESGQIRPNRVEVLPGGLAAVPEGLERLKNGKASAVKYVVHPQES